MADWLGDLIFNRALGTLWAWLTQFTLGFIPTWVWVLAALMAFAWVWRNFGWQGLLVLGGFLLTFGGYRQGWRDAQGIRKERTTTKQWPEHTPAPNKPLDLQLKDLFNSPKRKRRYNPDTNTWEEPDAR